MDFSESIKLMLQTSLERYPNPLYDKWATRYILGIDKTEKSWIEAQKNWEKDPWEDVHLVMLQWYDMHGPGRKQDSKDYLAGAIERDLKGFFLREKIPPTHYKL